MKTKSIFLKIVFFLLSIIAIFFLFLATYYFVVNKNVNLDVNKLKNSSIKYEFYNDENFLLLSENKGDNCDYIEIDKLHDYTLNSFIAIEDKRFYSHSGIDITRMIGATINNLKSFSIKEGASTISQQLIKNTHLSSEKTFKRKFNEIKLTLELENKYSKKQILEKYLNTIYFGGGAYGINNASKLYFGKDASMLDVNESCLLAGLIKSPSLYSPTKNYENSINRKNVVLNQMYKQKYISKEDYLKYKDLPIKITSLKNNDNYLIDYINAVKNEIEENIELNPYLNGNLKIYTYLDEKLQKNIFETKVESEYKYSRQEIVINNKNNGIIAFFGNNSTLKRSPASCIKPWYIYAPMINDKLITESTIITDEVTNFSGYTPKNYGEKYYGNVTIKDALSKSLNVPSVKLLDCYGFEKANDYSKKLGINIDGDNLSVALGAINEGVTLSQLCDCYTVFANNGQYSKSSFIKEIKLNNNTIYKNNNYSTKVFSEQTSFIINDILKESVLSGTAKKLKSNYDVCAKTGTNGNENGNIDAYTICYTNNHTVGVWLGNEDYSLLSNKISGGSYPAIYAKCTLDNLYKNAHPKSFDVPNGVLEVKIDNDLLINEQKTYISDNGKSYFYISGTEPTEYLQKEITPLVTSLDVNIDGNTVVLNLQTSNCDKVIIERKHNNKTQIVYEGTPNTFIEKLINDGIYYYTITPINTTNNLIGEKKISPSIKFNKNSKILNDDWWDD